MRLLRKGRLSCTSSSPDCKLWMVPSQNVRTEAYVTQDLRGWRRGAHSAGGNVEAGRLLKKCNRIILLPRAKQESRGQCGCTPLSTRTAP